MKFTEENIAWLNALLDDSLTKTKDKVKLAKLEDLKTKVTQLGEHTIEISIDETQIAHTNEVIQELEKVTNEYASQTDMSVLEIYDSLKKRLTSNLQFLSTYKDVFMSELNHIEDVLKKEIRIKIVKDIQYSEDVSFTQADKLVEKDPRYVQLKKEVDSISRIANRIKTKYDFYLKFWQMVFQSVSTASKEKYASRHNNDT